jgi:hypothetical protein
MKILVVLSSTLLVVLINARPKPIPVVEWPDYSQLNANESSSLSLPSAPRTRLNASLATLPLPQWVQCQQTSSTSYINFTFTPYPLRRGHPLNVSLHGWLETDLPLGTILEMESWRPISGLRWLKQGPRFRMDVCEYIARQFPDSPRPIKCPLSSYALLAVMSALQKRNQPESDDGREENKSTTQLQGSEEVAAFETRVPWWMSTGVYQTAVTLRSSDRVITCATALIRIE